MPGTKRGISLLASWIVLVACGNGSAERAPSTAPPSTATATEQDAAAPTTVEHDAGDAATVPSEPVPPECGQADNSLTSADADQLFDSPALTGFDFFLPPEQWEMLKLNARDEQYVSVQACFEGRSIGTVGLRFKGYYGSLQGCFDADGNLTCPRLSMKVKFDEYTDEQRFYGLKRLNFNAYRYDDSRIKEKLVYDLYRNFDVVAPRASWAWLRVNGEALGVFGMVEQIDGRFSADRWPSEPDGNLYKELWPTETGSALAKEALATNEETGDVSGFEAFTKAILDAPAAERPERLAQFMDLDYLMRYMAVDDAVANYDGVTYFWTDGVERNNHNFYIYEGSEHFTLIPWDVEASFWINPEHAAPHWTQAPEDCSLTYPYWDGQASAPGCDPTFQALQTYIPQWREASRQLLAGPFSEETMLANIERHVAFIGDAARMDPTPTMYTSFDDAVQNLRFTVGELRTRLDALIAE